MLALTLRYHSLKSIAAKFRLVNSGTVNPVQSNSLAGGAWDGCLLKLDPDGQSALYVTYLGGNRGAWCSGIAVDQNGSAFVVGSTRSTNFPTANAVQPVALGEEDAFVAKITDADTNPPALVDYEVSLEARRVLGGDFFCGLTFPVLDSHATLIVGGWGGAVVGISSLDDQDAAQNETTQYRSFQKDRWYAIRLAVTRTHLSVWIDDERLIHVATAGKKVALRSGEIEMSAPFGLATWSTTAELRNLRWRSLAAPAPATHKELGVFLSATTPATAVELHAPSPKHLSHDS